MLAFDLPMYVCGINRLIFLINLLYYLGNQSITVKLAYAKGVKISWLVTLLHQAAGVRIYLLRLRLYEVLTKVPRQPLTITCRPASSTYQLESYGTH